jgi:acetyl-CoA C-acetyltransferase/enoyl-CoA hydratase
MINREQAGPLTSLIIDRPERRNALDHASVKALAAALAEAEADAQCRCIVLRGAGGTFSSGRDLGDARHDAPLADILAYDEDWTDILHLLRGMSKPSVAVVEGHAVAGGFTLAMGCDFVIAERDAKFGALEMRGGFPAAVNTAILAHLAGPRIALEYLLSAETFPAEHLFRNRLVNHLADGPAELMRIVGEVTGRLAALDPVAVKLTKDAHRMAQSMPLAEAIVMGRQLNALLMSSGRITAARDKLKRPG